MKCLRRVVWLALILPGVCLWGQDQPSLVDKYLAKGVDYLEANQPQSAEREFLHAIQLDPENAPAYNLLGSVYDYLGEHDKADKSFLKAIKLAPSMPAPYNNLGISYLRQKRTAEALWAFHQALEHDPRNVTAHYNVGLLYMQEGEFRKAVAHLEQARSLQSEDPAILFNLGKAYFRAGDLNSALPLLQNLDRQPASSGLPEVQNLLGTVLTRLGQLDQAIAHLAKAAELDPTGADHHYRLALAWQKKGDLDKALREIQTAITLGKPPLAEHYLALGMIRRARSETEKANQAFKQAFEIAPDAASTRFALAVLLRDAGYYQEALQQFERARAVRHSDDLDFELAFTYYLLGEFPKALKLLEQILAAGQLSRSVGVYKLLAETYAKLERWPEALETLQKAVELDPRNPTLYLDLGLIFVNVNALSQAEQLFLGALKHLPNAAELYVGLAQARMSQDHYQEASDALRQAITLSPSYAEAHYLMGNCFNRSEQFADARQAYQKAIALSPERDDFHFSLGSLLENEGDAAAALTEFEKVIDLNPDSADGHLRLGQLYLQKGDYTGAIEHFRKEVALKPKDPRGYDQLARVYLKIGQRTEAQETLETVRELKRTAASANSASTGAVKLKPVAQYLRFLSR